MECGDGWKIAFVVTFLLVVLAVIVVTIILKSSFFPELNEKIRQGYLFLLCRRLQILSLNNSIIFTLILN